ncbi:MAG: hypothetical protein H6581_10790 [Bacteroidia bacterium]|nr:hypothetical protein [Bacteroidia bacterium]
MKTNNSTHKIRTHKGWVKTIARTLLVALVWQIFFPLGALALTGGPTTPEVQTFAQIDQTGMVDPFTGDFSYNIPLLDVGGYPVNLIYNAGISMDQEASWVGLGWNLNVGSITRNMRGIPDDFKGDEIKYGYNIKENVTVGMKTDSEFEAIGLGMDEILKIGLSPGIGVYYNNYRGLGFQKTLDISLSAAIGSKSNGVLGLGLNSDSQNGFSVSPSLSFRAIIEEDKNSITAGLFTSVNSRSGAKQLNVSADILSAQSDNIASLGGGTFQAAPSYTPPGKFPFTTTDVYRNMKINPEANHLFAGGKVVGYSTLQELTYKEISNESYGFIFESQAQNRNDVILDKNLEKDGEFGPKTPLLPILNHTYDAFQVTGHGISGQFRAVNGGSSVHADPYTVSNGGSYSLGNESGFGQDLKLGINLRIIANENASGRWEAGNMIPFAKGHSHLAGSPEFEPATFKFIGEFEKTDASLWNGIHQDKAVRMALDHNSYAAWGKNQWATSTSNINGLTQVNSQIARESRLERQKNISWLSAAEAKKAALQKTIQVDLLSGTGVIGQYNFDRNGTGTLNIKDHHISEFKVTDESGGRYVYGLPAYNISQKDVSFRVEKDKPTGNYGNIYSEGIVEYETGINPDNSINNTKGRDQYFSSTEIPPYAYAWHLTSYLSADYEDVTQDGPTPDDLGNYVLFNYSKIAGDYHWRFPYAENENEAKFDYGFFTTEDDDKGHYSYGVKEVYYPRSIETRDYVAEFSVSPRPDALEVVNEDGGKGTKSLYQLNEIRLFSKTERTKFGVNAKPLQKVNFTYDDHLCPGIPNHSGTSGGKLTLTKVEITYRDSNKGKLNPYEFTYSTFNPGYNFKGYDRWGYFAPPIITNALPDNAQWPYAEQNKSQADLYASAWNLTRIDLPSGGAIEVEYESDDYGYVQDKKAMRMFRLAGISNQVNDPQAYQNNKLFIRNNQNGDDEQKVLFFDLEEPVSGSFADPDEFIRTQYLEGVDPNLYFRCFVDLTGKGDFEYIPGYAEIEKDAQGKLVAGVDPNSTDVNGNFLKGYVKLKSVGIGDNDNSNLQVNPISKAAWQTARIYLPKLVYPGYNGDLNDPASVIQGLVGMIPDIKELWRGFNRKLRNKDFGQIIQLDNSWVRLQDPNYTKLGGGHRVKTLKVFDNWNQMATGEQGAVYGQEYYYTQLLPMSRDYDGSGRLDTLEVSSGVSSYEPLIGGDENPFRIPLEWVEVNKLAPDDRFYVEEPMGESFMPYPVVGYSRVLIRNLQYQDVKRNATGYTVSEFFTAKDYPTLLKNTGKGDIRKKGEFMPPLFAAYYTDHYTATQGYLIERNDMHGKPKANWVYPEPQDFVFNTPTKNNLKGYNPSVSLEKPLSGVEYYYQTKIKYGKQALDNLVPLVNRDGTVENVLINTMVDFSTEFREVYQHTGGVGIGVNLDLSTPPSIPIPTGFPSITDQELQAQIASTTKLLDVAAVLEKVIVWDRQANVPNETLAFDAISGSPVITRTLDEFHQYVYDVSLPAWWAYDRMGHSFKNADLFLEAQELGVSFLSVSMGKMILPSAYPAGNFFTLGDEVILQDDNGSWTKPYWVVHINASNPLVKNEIYLVDENGKVLPGTPALNGVKIIRSGRRNHLGATMETVRCKKNPLTYNSNGAPVGLNLALVEHHALAAGAVEYSENWQMNCGNQNDFVSPANAIKLTGNCYMNALLNLLNDLVHNGKLITLPGPDESLVGYSNYYSSGLYSEVDQLHANGNSATNGHCWRGQLGQGNPNQYLNGTILDCATGEPLCSVNLEITNVPQSNGNILCDFSLLGNLQSIAYVGPGQVDFEITGSCPSYPSIQINASTSCFDPAPCGGGGGSGSGSDPFVFCAYSQDSLINPYLHGILGHWRPKRSFGYLEDRSYMQATTSVRTDGYLDQYLPYWNNNSGNWQPNPGNDPRWQFSAEITKINERGMKVEEVDPIGNYSAALTGYGNSLVTAAGNNAKLRQIAFDGFEDYTLRDDQADCRRTHLDFVEFRNMLDASVAHTGKVSLKVPSSGTQVSVKSKLTPCLPENVTIPEYDLRECDCQEAFSPDAGKEYVVSAWVRSDNPGNPLTATSFTGPKIRVNFLDAAEVPLPGGAIASLYPAGIVVEGWQKIEGIIEIPAAAENIKLDLLSTTGTSWFDDIRIHPKEGNMISYVYDAHNRRLMAQLDENNFASFYEYDAEGGLVRVKKETLEGVFTLQESRTNLHK